MCEKFSGIGARSKPDFEGGWRQMIGRCDREGDTLTTLAGYGSAGEQPERQTLPMEL